MSYFPSKSVTAWCEDIFEIIGNRHDRAVKPLSVGAQYEIRKLNSDYLAHIKLGPVERARAEATRRNLLDGYVGPGLVL